MEHNMNDILNWLSDYFGYNKPFDEVLKDEKATSFLLIWPIFEQKLFNTFARERDIPNVADRLELNYNKYNVEEMTEYFYQRYQNTEKRRNLLYGKKVSYFIDILNKEYKLLSNKEKLTLILFVVYRYRNNIFHGNKGIKSWTKYSKQIDCCMKIMMKILDCISKEEK